MDLRVPSGFFFTLLGLILTGMGIVSPSSAPLTNANINLYCGLSMLAFGGVLLGLAKRARSRE